MAKAGKRKEMVEERTVKNRMSLRCVLHVVSEIVGVRESYVCVWPCCVWQNCLWQCCAWKSLPDKVVCVCEKLLRVKEFIWQGCVWKICVRVSMWKSSVCVWQCCVTMLRERVYVTRLCVKEMSVTELWCVEELCVTMLRADIWHLAELGAKWRGCKDMNSIRSLRTKCSWWHTETYIQGIWQNY